MKKSDKILISLGLVAIVGIATIFVLTSSSRGVQGYNPEHKQHKKTEYVITDEDKIELPKERNISTKKETKIKTKTKNSNLTNNKKEEYEGDDYDCIKKVKVSNGKTVCIDSDVLELETDGTREDRKRMISEIAIDFRDEKLGHDPDAEQIAEDPTLGTQVCKVFLYENIGLDSGRDSYNVYFCDENGVVMGKMALRVKEKDSDGTEYIRAAYYDPFLPSFTDFGKELYPNYMDAKFDKKAEFPVPVEEVKTHLKSELGDVEFVSTRLVSRFDTLHAGSPESTMYEVTVEKDGETKKYYVGAFTNGVIIPESEMRQILVNERESRKLPFPEGLNDYDKENEYFWNAIPRTEGEKKLREEVEAFMNNVK